MLAWSRTPLSDGTTRPGCLNLWPSLSSKPIHNAKKFVYPLVLSSWIIIGRIFIYGWRWSVSQRWDSKYEPHFTQCVAYCNTYEKSFHTVMLLHACPLASMVLLYFPYDKRVLAKVRIGLPVLQLPGDTKVFRFAMPCDRPSDPLCDGHFYCSQHYVNFSTCRFSHLICRLAKFCVCKIHPVCRS